MESFGGDNEDSVGEAASSELERLDQLEESSWYNQNLSCAPLHVKSGVWVFSLTTLTLMGVLFRDYSDTWAGIALLWLFVVAFVAGMIRLERRYSRIRTPKAFPPRRVFKKQWKLILLTQVPMYFFLWFFFSGVESGEPWLFFAGLVAVFLVVEVLWMLVLEKTGFIRRFTPAAIVTP